MAVPSRAGGRLLEEGPRPSGTEHGKRGPGGKGSSVNLSNEGAPHFNVEGEAGWSWERFGRCKINVDSGVHRGVALGQLATLKCPRRELLV